MSELKKTYSLTFFSKKLVFPLSEMSSMKSKGFFTLYTLGDPRATSRRSATNSMYVDMRLQVKSARSNMKEGLSLPSVHADERDWKSVCEELLLNGDCFGNDLFDSVWVRSALEVGEEKAGKVGVKTFVS